MKERCVHDNPLEICAAHECMNEQQSRALAEALASVNVHDLTRRLEELGLRVRIHRDWVKAMYEGWIHLLEGLENACACPPHGKVYLRRGEHIKLMADLRGALAKAEALLTEETKPVPTSAERELARVLSGDLTPEEFQTLCHNLPETCTPESFAEGCIAYQRKLFGRAPREDQHMVSCQNYEARIADLVDSLREARRLAAERLTQLEAVRTLWPHIETGPKRLDPGVPTCIRCKVELAIAKARA